MSRVVDSIFLHFHPSCCAVSRWNGVGGGVGGGGGFVRSFARFAKIPRVFRDRVFGEGWLVNSSASWMHPVA